MVQLKDSRNKLFHSVISKFQFLYGVIAVGTHLVISLLWCCFNSSMVQLKVTFYLSLQTLNPGFNSSMVQLQALSIKKSWQRYTVSIPLWYNWKFGIVTWIRCQTSFNSSMVQLEVVEYQILINLRIGFNSSMVQLEV
ncbi:hypothetical protein SAMN05428988_6308 [Chitinophaga sp. YR573]|nr:hypothetical protein SAMN05428988_6308 [Chitinophaga sp. YR573]